MPGLRIARRALKALRGARPAAPASPAERLAGYGPLPAKIPAHVAVIMDGNGRWADRRRLPKAAGHQAGTEALRDIIRCSSDIGVRFLTIYAFSTENWTRPKDEVGALMALLLRYFESEIDELCEERVRIRILGDVEGLPAAQRDAVKRAMERSKDNAGLTLSIALNYGGRAELLRAARLLCARAVAGENPDAFAEADMAAGLYTAGMPDVDLLIRTSGEERLSNFLPWQTTYAEMVFNPALWPDYTQEKYLDDIRLYASRDRRFGGRAAAAERKTDV